MFIRPASDFYSLVFVFSDTLFALPRSSSSLAPALAGPGRQSTRHHYPPRARAREIIRNAPRIWEPELEPHETITARPALPRRREEVQQ